MRILVTGGVGFIGTKLCIKLAGRGDKVVAMDNFNNSYDVNIKRDNAKKLQAIGVKVIEGEVGLCKKLHYEAVVHLASLAGVRQSVGKMNQYWENNVLSTVHLLSQTQSKVIFTSSSTVYAGATPFLENAKLSPTSPYAHTKKVCEKLVLDSGGVVLRLFNVYGSSMRPDLALPTFANAVLKGDLIYLRNTKRDFTHISDVVNGIILAIDKATKGGIYNIGTGECHEMRELLALVEDNLKIKANVEFVPFIKVEPKQTLADITNAKNNLGYAPIVNLKEGVEEFFKNTVF